MNPIFNCCARVMATVALLTGCATAVEPSTHNLAAQAEGTVDRLILLGTGGGPIARVSRSQPANLLQVGSKTYMIDIGAGTSRQIVRAGARLKTVDAIFITHLHFDHTAGLPAFLALDWQERRREPVAVYGPPGTKELVENSLRTLASGAAIFAPELPDLPPMASVFSGRDVDVTAATQIYRDDQVTVQAVENSHFSTMHLPRRDYGVDRSYSYRFDTPRRSIVFTGDTGPSVAVEQLARGADLLVSEVIDLPSILESLNKRGTLTAVNQQPLIDHMTKEHLTPENVGRLAAAAGVKQVVLTHFAEPFGVEAVNRERILAGIRPFYQGPVIFGEDLDGF